MIEPLALLKSIEAALKSVEILSKLVPQSVTKIVYWSRNRDRLKHVTLERIFPGSPASRQQKTTPVTNAFMNHVIRSSAKTNRFSRTNGKRQKITHPALPAEKRLVSFHSGCDYREEYDGLFYNDDGTQSKGALDRILLRLLLQSNIGIKNNIYYLTGSIGSGKSTLFSTLLVSLAQNRASEDIQRSKDSLPIDFCIVSFEDFRAPTGLETADELLSLLNKKILFEIASQTDVKAESLADALQIAAKSHRFSLFLDGLDYLYTEFCRITLLKPNGPMSTYYNSVISLLNQFTDGHLSELKINVLFSFRVETLEIIRRRNEALNGTQRISIPDNVIFNLEKMPAEKLSKVFAKRLSLAKLEDSLTPSVLVDSNSVFTDFYTIAVHGLRHLMDNWRRTFALVPIDKVEHRLYRDYRLFKLFFLASGTGLYSQINHGLTNIYLINPNFRVECGDLEASDAIKIDRPTYWLKYLMLVYLTVNMADITSAIKLFTTKARFDEKLIRIVLLGFSETSHGRIIKPRERGHLGDQTQLVGLEPTARGIALLENGTFFSFEYLCCVVEDLYLRVPSCLVSHFSEPRSLGFLAEKDDEDFLIGKAAYLKEKAVSVMTFTFILEQSYILEKMRDPELFRVFEDARYANYIPDFRKMRNEALQALDDLSKDLPPEVRRDILFEIKKLVKVKEIDLIRRGLKQVFVEQPLA